MAQECDRKEKLNFRVHLNGNKYILGDGMCYWIVRETKAVQKSGKKAGEEVVRRTRLTGYHTDFVSLVDSYYAETLKQAEIDGEIADLVKLMKKTRAEIRTWFGKWDDAWDI